MINVGERTPLLHRPRRGKEMAESRKTEPAPEPSGNIVTRQPNPTDAAGPDTNLAAHGLGSTA